MPGYELESVKIPVVKGRALRALAWAAMARGTRVLLRRRLLKDGGILKLRGWELSEPPTLYPIGASEDRAGRALTSTEIAESNVDEIATTGEGGPITARQIADAYKSGAATPVTVAEAFLAAVEHVDQGDRPLRLFIAIDRDDVLRQAEASAKRLESGDVRGPLEGIPVAVKDEVDMVPYPTTVGTSFLGDAPATSDSTVVARLRAAGALLIGKANMHEIGINPNGVNVHYGQARNPYNRARDPGGSSSGSAVAVAAGLCPIAIGADGGGSIRIPAALCGAVGLKATFGRISEHGAAPLCWSLAHLGPIASTVHDVALAYAAIAGADPLDPMSQHQPAVDLDMIEREDLSGVRVGVYDAWFDHATDDVVIRNRDALARLRAAGAELVEIEVPELEQMRVAHAVSILSEMAAAMAPHRDRWSRLGAGVRLNLSIGDTFTATDYITAQRQRTRAMRAYDRIFESVDVIATPATAVTAPPIRSNSKHGWSDLPSVTELMRFILPGNFVGVPAMAMPIGYDDAGLPVAIQLMANHWRESTLLRLGAVLEKSFDYRPPTDVARLLAT